MTDGTAGRGRTSRAGLRRRSGATALLVLLVLAGGPSARAAERVGLVIGNSAYPSAPLRNPVNDARAMAAALRELNFDVIEAEDADRERMARAIQDFAAALRPESVGLFYYAGHGIQSRGRNYLLPVDAQAATEQALRFEAIDVRSVLEEMELAHNRLNIAILDACRNNPFERRFRGASSGLAPIDAATGSIIAYATAPGSLAADGDGEHGLYTGELLKAIRIPGLQVEEVFKRVRAAVTERTGFQQVPWESSSLIGDFSFTAAGSGSGAGTAAVADARARPRAVEPAAPAAAAAEASPLDGVWVGKRVCPKGKHRLHVVVARGRVDMVAGSPGEPGYSRQTGTVDAQGGLALKLDVYNGSLQKTISFEGDLEQQGDDLSGTLTFTHPVRGNSVPCRVTLARHTR